MDLARRTYRTTIRPFRDSAIEVPIRWYRVPREWGTLPYPSAINSLDWYSEPLLKTGVGEVPGAPRTFVFAGPPAGGPFGHTCGDPEDFALGAPYRPDLPPTIYAANGLPLCCQPDVQPEPAGGEECGGSATVTVIDPTDGGGGEECGGSAVVTVTDPSYGQGGEECGGSALVTVVDPTDGGGGEECGGSAVVTTTGGGLPDTYFYQFPGQPLPVVMNRTGPTRWVASNGSVLDDQGGSAWQFVFTPSGAVYRTTGWDGTGTRVFDGVGPLPIPTVTITAGS